MEISNDMEAVEMSNCWRGLQKQLLLKTQKILKQSLGAYTYEGSTAAHLQILSGSLNVPRLQTIPSK